MVLANESDTYTDAFTGSVWFNLGCTYSYLFQNEKALECLKNAYDLTGTDKSLKAYLHMAEQTLPIEEYRAILKAMKLDDDFMKEYMEEQKRVKERPKVSMDKIDGILSGLAREYHRNTSE